MKEHPPPSVSPSSVTILHDTQEWTTNFENLNGVLINGQELLQTHDIAKKTEKLSRQIRLIAVLASTIAVVVLVLVSLIYGYEDGHHLSVERAMHSRQKIANRLYEVSGNIWVKDQWIVDPKWIQSEK